MFTDALGLLSSAGIDDSGLPGVAAWTELMLSLPK
jgi:hypothetical protein